MRRVAILDLKNNNKKCGHIEIKNQTENEAEICFYGDIMSDSWGEVGKKHYPDDKCPSEIKEFLDQLKDVDTIHVRINSGGGSVFGGIAIYNLLKSYKAKVIVHVDGIAASIASVIAMAGDEIKIPKNAMMMIHKPSTYSSGNANDLRKDADILDSCQELILASYMEHVNEGISENTINELINNETWYSGEKWKEYFNITVEESNNAVAASSTFYNSYKNAPEIKEIQEKVNADEIAKRVKAAVLNEIKSDRELRKKKILNDLDLI